MILYDSVLSSIVCGGSEGLNLFCVNPCSCCLCLPQAMLSLLCSVIRTPSHSLSTSTTEVTVLKASSSLLHLPSRRIAASTE